MDILGGKAIIDGPSNPIGASHRSVPIGITVEGANILTRNLMIFGQGAIAPILTCSTRCGLCPTPTAKRGWPNSTATSGSMSAIRRRTSCAPFCSGGPVVWPRRRPRGAAFTSHWRQLSRYAATFSMLADLALLTLGGNLKRREMISARLGDILSELYLLGATLKRFETDGRPEVDKPIVEFVMQRGFNRMGLAFAGVFANLPARWAAMGARIIAFPLGVPLRPPADELVTEVPRS